MQQHMSLHCLAILSNKNSTHRQKLSNFIFGSFWPILRTGSSVISCQWNTHSKLSGRGLRASLVMLHWYCFYHYRYHHITIIVVVIVSILVVDIFISQLWDAKKALFVMPGKRKYYAFLQTQIVKSTVWVHLALWKSIYFNQYLNTVLPLIQF